jgi:hypothetical protein
MPAARRWKSSGHRAVADPYGVWRGPRSGRDSALVAKRPFGRSTRTSRQAPHVVGRRQPDSERLIFVALIPAARGRVVDVVAASSECRVGRRGGPSPSATWPAMDRSFRRTGRDLLDIPGAHLLMRDPRHRPTHDHGSEGPLVRPTASAWWPNIWLLRREQHRMMRAEVRHDGATSRASAIRVSPLSSATPASPIVHADTASIGSARRNVPVQGDPADTGGPGDRNVSRADRGTGTRLLRRGSPRCSGGRPPTTPARPATASMDVVGPICITGGPAGPRTSRRRPTRRAAPALTAIPPGGVYLLYPYPL